MENLIIIAVVATIVGMASRYIYKSKKGGIKCIGCPEGCSCASKSCSGCNGCGQG